MNNKIFFLIIVILLIGTGWFFGKNTSIESPIKVETPEVDYEATGIKAIQTNEQGETEYEVHAKSLNHNSTKNKDELIDVTMDWQPSKYKKYQLTSGLTDLNQKTGELNMSNGFKLESKQDKNSEPIIIVGDSLTGNTKLKQVKTDNPIKFQQGDNQFTANGMVANLDTGDYEFTGVEVSFMPSTHKEKSLF